MDDELKPCPFCGAMPLGTKHWATCPKESCRLYGQYFRPETWNTRPAEDALRQRVQELEAQVHTAENVIASVVGCCTYASEGEAKVGAYGISPKAFTMIDEYIHRYMLPEPPKEEE